MQALTRKPPSQGSPCPPGRRLLSISQPAWDLRTSGTHRGPGSLSQGELAFPISLMEAEAGGGTPCAGAELGSGRTSGLGHQPLAWTCQGVSEAEVSLRARPRELGGPGHEETSRGEGGPGAGSLRDRMQVPALPSQCCRRASGPIPWPGPPPGQWWKSRCGRGGRGVDRRLTGVSGTPGSTE